MKNDSMKSIGPFLLLMVGLLIFSGSGAAIGASISASLPETADAPVLGSIGVDVNLYAAEKTACKIEARITEGSAAGWRVLNPSQYLSIEPGESLFRAIRLEAPPEENVYGVLEAVVINLSDGVSQTLECSLLSVQTPLPAGENQIEYPEAEAGSGARKASAFDALQSLSANFMAGVVWELGNWPLGYPLSKDPVVYSNQEIDVRVGVQNVSAVDQNLTYKVRVSKRNAVGRYSEVAQLGSATITVTAASTESLNFTWDTASEDMGEYRFELEGDGGTIGSAQFQIGRSQSANFVNCESEDAQYEAGDTVTLKQTASIENDGNVDLSGVLQVILYKYDSDAKEWELVEMLHQQSGVYIAKGSTYSLASLYPLEYDLPENGAEANGDYRFCVRLAQSTGFVAAVLETIIGAKVIGAMENALPSLTLDRAIGEDANSNGDLDPAEVGKLSASQNIKADPKDVLVKYTIAPPKNAKSLRSAGHFVVGEDLATELDIVFVCDTSGSMGGEWGSLLSIMGDIISDLSDLADVNYDIYALSSYYGSSYTEYSVDGVITDVLLLTQHETGHSESWGPGTEYLADNYPWRPDAIRVILPVSDEGAYQGDSWDFNDTDSVTAAIAACNNNQVIVYPMYGDWWDNYQGANYILPNMQRLASNTGGQAFYWGNDQDVIDTLTAALGQQVEFSARNVELWTLLTKGTTTADAHNWLATWLGDGNMAKAVRKTAGSADSQTGWAALSSTPGAETEEYIFSSSAGNTSALFQSLSLAPMQQLEVTFGLQIPDVGAGLTYTAIAEGDTLYYEDAFTGDGVFFPEFGGDDLPEVMIRAEEPTGDVLIVVDEERMRDIYGDAKINTVMTKLTDYATVEDATFLDVGPLRGQWEAQNNNDKSAFSDIYAAGVSECSVKGRYDWDTNGPDTTLKYPAFLDEVIGAYALARNAVSILLVGGDNVIPYQRIVCPLANYEGGANPYQYLNGPKIAATGTAARNYMWSDVLYGKINNDNSPDLAVSRLPGAPEVIEEAIDSGMEEQPVQETAMCAIMDNNHVNIVQSLWNGTKYRFKDTTDGSLYLWDKRAPDSNIRNDYIAGLDDGYALFYTDQHGNNYRDPGQGDIQGYWQDDGDGVTAKADEINLNGLCFWLTDACHAGCTYADDDTDHSLCTQAFAEGASAFMGHTHYVPFAGSDNFMSDLFKRLYDDDDGEDSFGLAVHATRRALLDLGTSNASLFAVGTHHYGLPTVDINIPPEAPKRKQAADSELTSTEDAASIAVQWTLNNWTEQTVDTDDGERKYITITDVPMNYEEGLPPVPIAVKRITLAAGVSVDLPPQVVINASTQATLNMPSMRNVGKSWGLSPYTGDAFTYTGNYPAEAVDASVTNEIDGTQTLVVRIYPVQYDASTSTAAINTDITVTFTKMAGKIASLASAEVGRIYDENSGLMTLILRNTGSMDLANLSLVETIPGNVIPDPDSIGDAVIGARKGEITLTWSIASLANAVGSNFTAVTYQPLALATGDYVFKASLAYESSAGVAGDDVENEETVSLKKSVESAEDTPNPDIKNDDGLDCFIGALR
ncbi:hypothetical protein Dalk_1221 [Desulfatibacillum aliphaticivorans]|uniref:VWFA domain-containing protein n=1 Tax=Desulfatibacillum aliphaticivorans TaxID=218208 RepID=B8F9H8_DESAL|nr:hypothetical protein [Desulfatibacillum aliphaticivorans]ACL02924.1 hypothetical protein Dalk_1221 [Desulfatibacillum aliphaticivorans]